MPVIRARALTHETTSAADAARSASTSVCSSGIRGSQPGGRAQLRGVAGEHAHLGWAQALVVALHRHRDAGGLDQQLDHAPQRHGAAGADVVDARGSVEQQPVGAADVAHVGQVALHVEVADSQRSSALGAQARELRRPGADREALVLAGADVREGARDDSVDARRRRALRPPSRLHTERPARPASPRASGRSRRGRRRRRSRRASSRADGASARSAATTFTVPSTFVRQTSAASPNDCPTDEAAARCTTALHPRTAVASAPGSSTSPS